MFAEHELYRTLMKQRELDISLMRQGMYNKRIGSFRKAFEAHKVANPVHVLEGQKLKLQQYYSSVHNGIT